MQHQAEELKYQQMVLRHLGFYRGKIDGIWSSGSIEAKRQYEFDKSFRPAIPNNGLPFGTSDRLPANLSFTRKGNVVVLMARDMTDEDIKRMLGNTQAESAKSEPVIEAPATPLVIEAPTEEQAVQAAPTPVVPNQNQQRNQQQNQQQRNQQNQQQRR